MTPLLLLHQAIRQKAPATLPAIDRIANRLEPQLRKRFLEAVAKSKGNIDLEQLARLILSGNMPVIEHEAGVDDWTETYKVMKPEMRSGFIAGATVAATLIGASLHGSSDGPPSNDGPIAPIRPSEPPSGKLTIRLDLINHYAVSYADRKLPILANEYKEGAREAIRRIVSESVSGKHTAQEAAKLIRDYIGLTNKYSIAAERMREALTAQGVAAVKIEKKVKAYSDKLLRSRAKTIARTEILQAQAAGRRVLWNEAANLGIINRHTARNVWVTHEDELTCKFCMAMDGQEIPFGGAYTHPESGSLNMFGEPLLPSFAHPNCRCSEDLIL